jgi:hypothetical protein
MEVHLKLQITKDYFLGTLRRARRQLKWQYYSQIAFKCFGIVIALLEVRELVLNKTDFASFCRVLPLVLFLFFLFEIREWFLFRQYKTAPFYGEVVDCTISDEGVRMKSPKFDSNIQWPFFSRAVQVSGGVLLFQGKLASIWFSEKYFEAPEDYVNALAIIRAHVSKFKA